MPEIVGRLRPPRLSAAPASPAVGEVYYDTAANILYFWNGTIWVALDHPRRIYTATPASTQTTATTYAFWPTEANFASIAIPAGMTHALIVYTINRIYSSTAGGALWWRPQVGSTVGREFHVYSIANTAETGTVTIADEIALGALAGTSQQVALAARHTTQPFTIDSTSRISLDLEFVKR